MRQEMLHKPLKKPKDKKSSGASDNNNEDQLRVLQKKIYDATSCR